MPSTCRGPAESTDSCRTRRLTGSQPEGTVEPEAPRLHGYPLRVARSRCADPDHEADRVGEPGRDGPEADLPQGSVLPDQFVTRQINVGGIGLAISADGLSWTRFAAPVLTPDSLQPGATVGDPSVLVLSN